MNATNSTFNFSDLTFDKYNLGIDYLRLKICPQYTDFIKYFDDILYIIDNDNSNYYISQDFEIDITYNKVSLSNGVGLIASCDYFGISVPIFIYLEYHNKSFLNAYGKLDFYGSFFRLLDLGYLKNYFFDDFIKPFPITRLDYRIDFFSKDGDIILDYSDFLFRSNSRIETHSNKGKINSWRIGNKENRSVIVRGYDKKLDISNKGKFRLFGDYQEYNSVFRLEYEFGGKFCYSYFFSTLDELVDKAKKRIGFLESSFVGRYLKTYEKLDLTDEYSRTRYCKIMNSYIKNALLNGINVYDFVDVELKNLGYTVNDILEIRNGTKSLLINNT